MSSYTTREFWAGTAERAIKTFAQALLGVLTGGASGLLDVDWVAALSVAGLAAVGSVLTSLATPDFTAGAPVEDYAGKHEAPDPRHHVAD